MNKQSAASGEGPSQKGMGAQDDQVTVQVKYKGVEKTFAGNVQSVWLSLNRFFNDFLPSFEIAQRLTLSVDLQKLAGECEGIIGFAKEGPCLLVPRSELTDAETLSLLLLAGRVGHELGKVETEAVSKDELQSRLGKDAKIASARLGELVKSQMAVRTPDDKYRITTFGIVQMQREIIPKIKAKMGI